MHPDTMRRIDRWVGIPLCAVASLLLPWLAPRRQPNTTAPDTVVLICIAEIGALLVAHPAIVRARKLFPESRLCFITGPGGKGALEVMDFPDADILTLRTDSLAGLIADCLKLRKTLSRAGTVHAAVLEPFTRFSHLVWLKTGDLDHLQKTTVKILRCCYLFRGSLRAKIRNHAFQPPKILMAQVRSSEEGEACFKERGQPLVQVRRFGKRNRVRLQVKAQNAELLHPLPKLVRLELVQRAFDS